MEREGVEADVWWSERIREEKQMGHGNRDQNILQEKLIKKDNMKK